jgi:hypothetical protein
VHSASQGVISNLYGFLAGAWLVPTCNLAHQLHLQEAENRALDEMVVTQVWQEAEITGDKSVVC